MPEAEKETLNKFIERFIKEIKSGERLHNNQGAHEPVLYTEGTIKNYEGFMNIWNNFQGENQLDFEDIDKSVDDRFIQYCVQLPNQSHDWGVVRMSGFGWSTKLYFALENLKRFSKSE